MYLTDDDLRALAPALPALETTHTNAEQRALMAELSHAIKDAVAATPDCWECGGYGVVELDHTGVQPCPVCRPRPAGFPGVRTRAGLWRIPPYGPGQSLDPLDEDAPHRPCP